MAFDSIPDILADIRAGKMVVILDDEDRENEGDLVMAASLVRPEDINFMARHGRGLICLSLTRQRCEQLGLRLMVEQNTARHSTNFTVSIEAAEGVTTGISAYDRALTIRTAVKPDARAADLSQPGHIFPLMAQPGGVLTRAGHTEASLDLACLAGLEPAGVIVEILNEDGSMARRPELEEFARRHGLRMGTIADLIAYRLGTEKTVQRIDEREVRTEFGDFRLVSYRDVVDKALHFALIRGDLSGDEPVLTRVHVKNLLSDVLHIEREDFSIPVSRALREIDRVGRGVVVVIADSATPEQILQRLTSVSTQVVASNEGKPAASIHTSWRRNGLGAQILADLGVHKLRVMGSQRRFLGLSGFGLEVVDWQEV